LIELGFLYPKDRRVDIQVSRIYVRRGPHVVSHELDPPIVTRLTLRGLTDTTQSSAATHN
jgi:hypothetical protein